MGGWLESLVPWGTEAIIWVQSFSTPFLDALFKAITFLGNTEFYLLFLPFIYWCVDRRIGLSLGYLSLSSAWLNSVVKFLFKIPRPTDPPVRVLVHETSPSFPSGHAQGSVVNWAYLAYRLRKPFLWVIALLVLLTVPLSRIVLGAHYPQDVIGGLLIGLVVLVAFILAEPPLSRWVAGRTPAIQVLLAVGVPLVLILLHPSDVEGHYPASDAITPMASLIGFGVGAIMDRAYLRFRVDGAWGQRILRYLVGLLLAGIFYLGPRLILPEEMPHGLEVTTRLVRYVLVGWTVSYLGPWLFVRLGLAGKEEPPPLQPPSPGASPRGRGSEPDESSPAG